MDINALYYSDLGSFIIFWRVAEVSVESLNLGPLGPTATPPSAGVGNPVEVVRTYLGLPSISALTPAPLPRVPVRLDCLAPCPVDRWRSLYAQIGAPWHWHDRDAWDDQRIAHQLARAEVQVYQLGIESDGQTVTAGFLELERHPDGATEIVYLGIDRAFFGQGIGGWLLTEAVRIAFADGATRVWLHTCTLDGPAALPNYQRRGFQLERTETYHTTLPA